MSQILQPPLLQVGPITFLADAFSSNTVISSFPRKEVYDPQAFLPHAALLRQAFAHCGRFLTAASRRSLGRVSVPVWPIVLSDRLLIMTLAGPLPQPTSQKVIRRKPVFGQLVTQPFTSQHTRY